MEITVKTLDSKSHKFTDVDDSITVKQFKERIASQVNVPQEKQRLIFRGRVLKDDQKLRDCDVDGKVLHLVEKAPPLAARQSSGQSSSATSSSSSSSSTTTTTTSWSSQHPHRVHFQRTTSASAQGTPPSQSATSSLGSLLGNLPGIPSDVFDMTHQIVQGLVGSFENSGAQTEVTSASLADGQGVNVQINVNRLPSELARLYGRLEDCYQALAEIREELDRREGGRMQESSPDQPQQQTNRRTGSSAQSSSPPTEFNEQAMSTDLSNILTEIAAVTHHLVPHIRSLAENPPRSSHQLQPPIDHSTTRRLSQLFQLLSQACSALSDFEIGYEDLVDDQVRLNRRQSEQQNRRQTQEQPRTSQSGVPGGEESRTSGGQSGREASQSSQMNQQMADAISRVIGAPVARMEIEMDQYEAPLQEMLAHGLLASGQTPRSENNAERPSVEFMVNFIQHVPVEQGAGRQQSQQSTLSESPQQQRQQLGFLRSFAELFPMIAANRRQGGREETERSEGRRQGSRDVRQSRGGETRSSASESPEQSGGSQTVQSTSTEMQDKQTSRDHREEQEQRGTREESRRVEQMDTGDGASSAAGDESRSRQFPIFPSSLSPELFRSVSETLLQAVTSAYTNPSEQQPSVHEVFSGLADMFGAHQREDHGSLFGRLMDTVWTSLTAPEALGLFRGLVEPLEKLHAPFREFISKELLHGVPLRDDNVEEAVNVLLEGEDTAIDFILSDCHIRNGIDLRATLLQSARRHSRHVIRIIQRDYDTPCGFANALKTAFISGISELSHLAVYGLDGDYNLLHETLRSRLAAIWQFPPAVEEFHRCSYQLCIGEYIDSMFINHPLSDEEIQPLVVRINSLPPAVAVANAECQTERERQTENIVKRTSFSLPQWLQLVPDQLPEVDIGREEWHQSIDNEMVAVVTRDLQTQKSMPGQRAFSDAYTSCIPPKRRKAAEVVSGSAQEATGDTLRSAIVAAGVRSSVVVDDIVRDAVTHPGLSDTYTRELQLQLEERIARDTDFDPDAFPNSALCFRHDDNSRRS